MKLKKVEGLIPSTVNGKPVKNLGWLLRNWQKVDSFVIRKHPPVRQGFQPDVVLVAKLKCNEGEYVTGFSCASVLRDWLNRPVFRGVPATWETLS